MMKMEVKTFRQQTHSSYVEDCKSPSILIRGGFIGGAVVCLQ